MIIVSGCLVGIPCRYDGTSETVEKLKQMVEKGEAIAVCPEQLAGLPTPRPGAEIYGGDGKDVIAGRCMVFNSEGDNVTEIFLKGAGDTLVIAEDKNVELAVLKSRSPSCGSGVIFDGRFAGRLKKGDGVTAALLKRHGIRVVTEEEFAKMDKEVEACQRRTDTAGR